jgi:hypothetical protein
MEPRSGTRRKIKPRCIVNYTMSNRSAIRPLEMKGRFVLKCQRVMITGHTQGFG